MRQDMTEESCQHAIELITEERANFERGEGEIRTIELEMVHKDGHPYWIEISARFTKDIGEKMKIIGITKDIRTRKAIEEEKNSLIERLQTVLKEKDRLLDENRVLRGLLPICASCKRPRDENGKWWPLDAYVRSRTEVEITHTICPDCKEVLYPGL